MIQRGDWVEFLDDTLSGVVKKIQEDKATVETQEGFLVTCPLEKLIKKRDFKVDPGEVKRVSMEEKKSGKTKINRIRKAKKNRAAVVEIDLHIEELVPSIKNMTDFDILNLQLETARRHLEWAIGRHIQHLVFIHGVGKGVLRMELETLLSRYDQVEYYDADYALYGRGATAVYIYQNY